MSGFPSCSEHAPAPAPRRAPPRPPLGPPEFDYEDGLAERERKSNEQYERHDNDCRRGHD